MNLDCFACINVEQAKLCLGSQRHDCLDHFGDVENGAIAWGDCCVFRDIMVSPCLTVCIAFVKVVRIAVCGKIDVAFALC